MGTSCLQGGEPIQGEVFGMPRHILLRARAAGSSQDPFPRTTPRLSPSLCTFAPEPRCMELLRGKNR